MESIQEIIINNTGNSQFNTACFFDSVKLLLSIANKEVKKNNVDYKFINKVSNDEYQINK